MVSFILSSVLISSALTLVPSVFLFIDYVSFSIQKNDRFSIKQYSLIFLFIFRLKYFCLSFISSYRLLLSSASLLDISHVDSSTLILLISYIAHLLINKTGGRKQEVYSFSPDRTPSV